jgi:hypothetical protein
MHDLFERTRAYPFDGSLFYDLAVALFKKGLEEEAVRHLDRAFRLDRLNIVRFLAAPGLKSIRSTAAVQRLLVRLRREEEQRIFAGYS